MYAACFSASSTGIAYKRESAGLEPQTPLRLCRMVWSTALALTHLAPADISTQNFA
jgi:hypothetical protein